MSGFRVGVRVKFNLVLLPLLAVTIAVFGWLDSRHEVQAVMAAHAIHVVSTSVRAPSGPVDPATSPEAVGRRALLIHAVFGVVVLALILITVNGSVWFLVLRPLDRVRRRIEQMTRGEWRGTVGRASNDELGRLTADFDQLGLAVDALAGQLLHAERLATLALVSKRLECSLLPEVQRTVAALSRLQASNPAAGEECQEIADAATRIIAAMRGLDRLFDAGSPGRRSGDLSGCHQGSPARNLAATLLLHGEESQVTYAEPTTPQIP